jgi:release factor glutamine methyltransferase
MIDIKHALSNAVALLKTSPSPRIDAEALLCFVLNTSRAFLYAHLDHELSVSQWTDYQTYITKRVNGYPIAYLIGKREFWSLMLQALTMLANKSNAQILDLGTGTGAIALALGKECPGWQILACDKNPMAVEVAHKNVEQFDLKNIQILLSDWFSSIEKQRFHAILSNPPYIAEQDPHLVQGDLRFEPREALVSGPDGLNALRYLIETSYHWLVPGGLLLLEHGFDQGQKVRALMQQSGYHQVESWRDYQDHERVTGGYKPMRD